jgi:hypothetical protein
LPLTVTLSAAVRQSARNPTWTLCAASSMGAPDAVQVCCLSSVRALIRQSPLAPRLPPWRNAAFDSRSPTDVEARKPAVSAAGLVTTLITPLTAFTPHSVPPGPLITSMRSMFSSITLWASQNTPENSGV